MKIRLLEANRLLGLHAGVLFAALNFQCTSEKKRKSRKLRILYLFKCVFRSGKLLLVGPRCPKCG